MRWYNEGSWGYFWPEVIWQSVDEGGREVGGDMRSKEVVHRGAERGIRRELLE
jgi:hypothetical protein